MDLFEQLLESDDLLRKELIKLVDSAMEGLAESVRDKEVGRYFLDNYRIVGSTREGCLSGHLFTRLIPEMDMLVRVGSTPHWETDDVVCAEPGFYKFNIKKLIDEHLKSNLPSYPHVYTEVPGNSIYEVFELISDPNDADQNYEVNGAALNVCDDLFGVRQRFDVDLVMYIEVKKWPDTVASEWRARKRFWPPDDVVEKAIQFPTQLVDKPLRLPSGEIPDKELLRLSFTLSENFLAEQRTKNHQLVYLIAKSIFYRDMKLEMKGQKFSSYFLKTGMMWMLEETEPDRWQDVIGLVYKLYEKMHGYLEKKYLPYYFMPEVNLLSEYCDEILDQARIKVKALLDNFDDFMPTRLDVRQIRDKARLFVNMYRMAGPMIKRAFASSAHKESSDTSGKQVYYEEDLD